MKSSNTVRMCIEILLFIVWCLVIYSLVNEQAQGGDDSTLQDIYIEEASGLMSTTYGYGEKNCGDIGKPRPCGVGAVTASGVPFEPDAPMAAVFAPTKLRWRAVWVRLKVGYFGDCGWVLVADKGNPRFIGKRGFDLSPGALRLLIGKADPKWSDVVFVCHEGE